MLVVNFRSVYAWTLFIYSLSTNSVYSWTTTTTFGGVSQQSGLSLHFHTRLLSAQRPEMSCYASAQRPAVEEDSIATEHLPPKMQRATLAADYVIVLAAAPSKVQWFWYPIEEITKNEEPTLFQSDGSQAKRALEIAVLVHEEGTMTPPSIVLTATTSTEGPRRLEVSTEVNKDESVEGLVVLLERIFGQWAYNVLCHSKQQVWQVVFPFHSNENVQISISPGDKESSFRSLFASEVNVSSVEWVEMVAGVGRAVVLGQVPRPLVHKYNLLHRGIGAFVTEDRPMNLSGINPPALYVHQRVATKRVFPSLYDMFVGGVSLANEDPFLTAQREVAEELGLTAALVDDTENRDVPTSGWKTREPVLTCVVCTAYNRCVVNLFSYTMQTDRETVSWQQEEVSWGCFVPYQQVVHEADQSIQRLFDEKKWPGTSPPIQSRSGDEGTSETSPFTHEGWDFVPDGLLVWEAWLLFSEGE